MFIRGYRNIWCRYCSSINYLVDEFGGVVHWAKMELPPEGPDYDQNLGALKQLLAGRYPLKQFNEYRNVLDPNDILTNKLIGEVLSTSSKQRVIS